MSGGTNKIITLSDTRDFSRMERLLRKLVHNVPRAWVGDENAFNENCRQINERWKEAKTISRILRDLKSNVTYNDRRLESMNRMLVYLGLVESLGNTLMDMFIMVLIMNGRQIHTRLGPNVKHVRYFRELKDTTLEGKMDFLKNEGFSFFKTFIDKNTRDTIAHLKFTIEEDGAVKQKDRTRSPIDIQQKINQFWDGVHQIERLFDDIEFFKYFRIPRGDEQ